MVSSSIVVLIALLMAFNYLVVYKKNKIVGDMVYFVTGLGIMAIYQGDAIFIGTIIWMVALISLIYDWNSKV